MTREKKPARPRRRGRRRLVGLVLLLAGLLLGLRIALPYALPSVLDSLVADAGWSLRYGYMNLSLLSGTVQIGNLELFERGEDGEPIPEKPVAQLEYARVDLDIPSIFGGTLRFDRVDVDGLDVWLESDAEGDLVIPAGVIPDMERGEVPAPENETAEQVSFTPPVSIGAARLQRVRLHVREPNREDAVDPWVEANLRLTDLGGPTPTHLELKAYGPNLVDALNLEAHGTIGDREAEIALEVTVQGLRPHNAKTWLRALGLEPQAEILAASLQGTLWASAPSAPETVVIDADLSRMHVTADREEQVAFKSALVKLELAPNRILLRNVTIDGLRGEITLLEDGGLHLAGLQLPAASSAESPPETTEPSEPGTPLQLDTASLTAIALHLRDETVAPPVDIHFLGDRLELTDLIPEESEQNGKLELEGQLPGIADHGVSLVKSASTGQAVRHFLAYSR